MKRSVCIILAMICALLSAPVSVSYSESSPINILLLGTDNFGAQVGENEGMSRADAIYVLSLDKAQSTIKLLSIERDYLAVMPDGLGENKLGTATYFGGPEMAMKVINKMFDLDIALYAHIDIYNMINAINLFGGVDVEIMPDEVDETNRFIDGILIEKVPHISAGINHLSGLQAWSFMGVRSHDIDPIESNIERNSRQKRIMSALLEQASKKDLSVLLKLVNEILPLITTNISTAELLNLVNITLSLQLDQMQYQRTPFGPYSMKRVRMHRVVVPESMEHETEKVHQFLYGK